MRAKRISQKSPQAKRRRPRPVNLGLTLLCALALAGGPAYGQSSYPNPYAVDDEQIESNSLTGSEPLVKQGPGRLILNGDNSGLTGGVQLEGGTIAIGHDQALGVTTSADTTNIQWPSGWVTVSAPDGRIEVTEDRTIQSHFQLGTLHPTTGYLTSPGAALTIDIAEGRTLTIGQASVLSDNYYLNNGAAITVLMPSTDGAGPLRFTGGGSLVISSNTTDYPSTYGSGRPPYGGGLGVFVDYPGPDYDNRPVVLDLTGLASLRFENNIAGVERSGYGGGLGADSDFAAVTVTMGDRVSFINNIASQGHSQILGSGAAGEGGGVYLAAGGGPATLTMGDWARFDNNLAGLMGTGQGGGIYVYVSSEDGAARAELGDHAVFNRNMAGAGGDGQGGGIHTMGSIAQVVVGRYADFTGNQAGQHYDIYSGSGSQSGGKGGAIYANTSVDNGQATVSLAGNVYFSGNQVGNGQVGGEGGAIWSGGSAEISGHSFFSDNLASRDLVTMPIEARHSAGGAIFMAGTSQANILKLNADNGDIAFAGNYVEVEFTQTATPGDPLGVVLDQARANSVHLDRGTGLVLDGPHNIYFDDPISSGQTGGNSLVKTGDGLVQFMGSNVLNPSGFNGGLAADIQAGVFRLAQGDAAAEFNAGGGGFRLAPGATLAGQGTITAGTFSLSGLISPDRYRFEIPDFVIQGDMANGATETNYNFFKPGRTTVDAGQTVGTLTLTGDAVMQNATLIIDIDSSGNDLLAVTGQLAVGQPGGNTIELYAGEMNKGQPYTIITAAGFDQIIDDQTFAVKLLDSPLGGRDRLDFSQSTAQAVIVELLGGNVFLDWTGAQNSRWDQTAKDWLDEDRPSITQFVDGDAPLFKADGHNQAIHVSAPVSVAAMNITGGVYRFSGAEIRSDGNTVTTLLDAELLSAGYRPRGLNISGGATRVLFNNSLYFNSGITVTDGAVIGGTGHLKGGLTLTDKAILTPGNSIGTMTVDSVTFDATTFFEVEVQPDNTNQSDRLIVTGPAELGQATVRHIGLTEARGHYNPVGQWLILTADTLNGQFNPQVESRFAFLDPSLIYRPNEVWLKLARNDVEFIDMVPDPSYNQKEVGGGLDGDGPISKEIVGLPIDADFGRIYNNLAGEIHATLHGALMDYERSFAQAMRGRLRRDGERREGHPLWVSLEGRHSRTDRTRNTARARLQTWALSLGGEAQISDRWLAGLALRIGDNDLDLASGRREDADITSLGLGGYLGGSYEQGPGRLNLLFGGSYGFHQVGVERRVYGLSRPQKLSADYHAHSAQVFAEVGYELDLSRRAVIEPYLGLAWNSIWSQSFTESGGTARLRAGSNHNDNLSSTLGLRWQMRLAESVALTADLRWQHLFGDTDPAVDLAFTNSRDFTILGAPLNRNAAGLDLGLSIDLTPTTALRGLYEGNYGDNAHSHGARLTLHHHF